MYGQAIQVMTAARAFERAGEIVDDAGEGEFVDVGISRKGEGWRISIQLTSAEAASRLAAGIEGCEADGVYVELTL